MNQQAGNTMIHKLGKTNIKITSIIMGCWQMNGTPYWRGVDDKTSRAAVLSALHSGINTFDTAAVYGQSEALLGKTLKKYRQDVVIATKVFSNKLDYEQVLISCENSLKNLQTDYIDLLQIHFPSGTFQSTPIPIEETMAAFSKLKKSGKIRAIGASNFSLSQLKEACKYEEVDSVQPPYSLFWRSPVDELRSYCEKNDISILAYSPLAQGLLTGKFSRNHQFHDDEIRSKQILLQKEHYNRMQDALDALRPIAEKNKISLSELALAWIISQPKTAAVVGIRTPDQAINNAKTMKQSISKADLHAADFIARKVSDHLKDQVMMWDF